MSINHTQNAQAFYEKYGAIFIKDKYSIQVDTSAIFNNHIFLGI
jgi:hypothetical protein